MNKNEIRRRKIVLDCARVRGYLFSAERSHFLADYSVRPVAAFPKQLKGAKKIAVSSALFRLMLKEGYLYHPYRPGVSVQQFLRSQQKLVLTSFDVHKHEHLLPFKPVAQYRVKRGDRNKGRQLGGKSRPSPDKRRSASPPIHGLYPDSFPERQLKNLRPVPPAVQENVFAKHGAVRRHGLKSNDALPQRQGV